MAYAALNNLSNTIWCLEKFSRLSSLPFSFDTLYYPKDETKFLLEVLILLDERGGGKKLKAFHVKIREVAHGLEDVLESLLSNVIRFAQSNQSIGNEHLSMCMEEVRQVFNFLVETVKKVKEYGNELEYSLPQEEKEEDDDEAVKKIKEYGNELEYSLTQEEKEEDDDEAVKKIKEYGNELEYSLPEEEKEEEDDDGKKPKMVRYSFEELITRIIDQLNTDYESYELRVFSIVGVAGTGRSIFAWILFHHKKGNPLYNYLRAWVCVGPKYEFKEILVSILSQIDDPSGNDHKLLVYEESEEKIFEYLHAFLKGRKYLIVLDDVWETQVWEYLRNVFPIENNGSRVLLTTHLQEVAVFAQSFRVYTTHVLNNEESWNFISRALFPNKKKCPRRLERAGKKIAENCEGLLVEVAKYAVILSEVDQTPEHWNMAAEEMESSVANDAYDETSEIYKMLGDDCHHHYTPYFSQTIERVLGLPDATDDIENNLFLNEIHIYHKIVAVVGMTGVNNRSFAREVFDDPRTLCSYDNRVWLTLGPKYQVERILADILAQLDPNVNKMHMEDDETSFKNIISILSGKRCFIVLDDVWYKNLWGYLRKFVPFIKCEVLLTTSLMGIPLEYFDEYYRHRIYEIGVFGEMSRPSIYEEEVRQGVNSFVEMVKKIKEEYYNSYLKKWFPRKDYDDEEEEEEEKDNESSLRTDFGGKKLKMVGSNSKELITKIKDQLNTGYKSCELRVVSIVGVVGSGRSAFAWSLFHNPNAASLHELRALVCVGPKYEFKDILISILSQINGDDHKLLVSEGEEKIFEYLHTILKGGEYLIVLDDVLETRVWEYLRRLFPDESNGSRVLLTTHLEEVAVFAQSFSIHRTPVLNDQESWDFMSRVLYPEENRCPPEFEKVGKKIAKNCKGLLFEVATYADRLSGINERYTYNDDDALTRWDWVAEEMVNFVVDDAYDEISKISYILRDDILVGRYSGYCNYSFQLLMEKARGLPDAIFDIGKSPTYVAVVGMPGIGKTALAREVFYDAWTLHSYDHRVWLTVGKKYSLLGILVDILAQLDPKVDKMHLQEYHETPLRKLISSILSSKRCFIVLDDVWDSRPWNYLSEILQGIKCEVLLTTRISGISSEYFGESGGDRIHEMKLLNKEESWTLLRERIFGEKWPLELEKPGKMIAENCEGLPLTIVTVASLLSKADEKTPEYWNEVAKNKNSIFEVAYLKISKVLYPSYKELCLEDRTWFLYMAAFRLKYEIPVSKLFILYNVEGIIPPNSSRRFDSFLHYLEKLVDNSLVMVQFSGKFNTCRLHSVFWHFCVREARNDKFFHVMKRRSDGLSEDIEKQRRLCVQNNVLFALKDVYDSMASISAARSLLCFGPPHQYQVPICLESKFLKVLDALNIRFYEFPVGIFKLVLLRYLALTYNDELPAEISKLWSLKILIIHRHRSIKYPGDLSYLPIEIWDMKELKHLQIVGSNLPDGPDGGAILDRLLTLLDVRAESCTESIFEKIPNLEKLGVRIELEPDHASEPSFSFDHISYLQRLQSLKCVIVNPELKPVVVATPAPFSILPSSLKELTLSGLGYPWEHMRPIALLPNLEELELQCYAFQGAEWVMHEGDFNRLRYLLLEDTDLVDWRADEGCYLQSIQYLNISHCFKLKEIPWQCVPRSCKAELVDCNPSALEKMPKNDCQIICSWVENRTL